MKIEKHLLIYTNNKGDEFFVGPKSNDTDSYTLKPLHTYGEEAAMTAHSLELANKIKSMMLFSPTYRPLDCSNIPSFVDNSLSIIDPQTIIAQLQPRPVVVEIKPVSP